MATLKKAAKPLTRGQKAAETRKRNAMQQQATTTSGMSANLIQAARDEWESTERSDAAEDALLREYQYHALRCEELRVILIGVGIVLPGWEA